MQESAASNFLVLLGYDQNGTDNILHLLLPIPLMSLSPKIPVSWKSAK